MDGYRLVLFLHLSALLGAIATAAVLHFAETRLRAADTTAAVRTWAGLIDRGRASSRSSSWCCSELARTSSTAA
jgi:hypothetical protein